MKAHGVMMQALVDDAGRYRRGGVGVFGDKGLVHLAPPAERVPMLMADLFDWLKHSKTICLFVPVYSTLNLSLSIRLLMAMAEQAAYGSRSSWANCIPCLNTCQ